LGDANKRARYDQFGHAGVGGAAGGGFGGGMSMDDIFSQFGDIFGGHFGGFGGFGGFGSQRAGRRTNRGSDLRVKVKVNLKEVLTGVEKKSRIKNMSPVRIAMETVRKMGIRRVLVLPVMDRE